MKTTNRWSSKVEAAAKTEATRLCDAALATPRRFPLPDGWPVATSEHSARAKRYQLDVFRNLKLADRVVCDLLRGEDGDVAVDSREEFLAARDLYCAAGIAEVERRFAT